MGNINLLNSVLSIHLNIRSVYCNTYLCFSRYSHDVGSTVCTIEKENEKEKEQVLKVCFYYAVNVCNLVLT